jgi:hypothetical protein
VAELAALREALAASFAATMPATKVYRYYPTVPDVPCIAIRATTLEPDRDTNGVVRVEFTCWVFVGGAELERGQAALDRYLDPLSPASIPAAIDADVSLGGLVHYARYLGFTEPAREVDAAGATLLAQPALVEVLG